MAPPRGTFAPAAHTTVKRGAKRATWDRNVVYDVLDAQLVASIAFANTKDTKFEVLNDEYYPTVLPTGYVRDGDCLLFHGKSSSLLQKRLASGIPICVSIFTLDALVCAKAAMHHSVNYRAVVIYGRAEPVEDSQEKQKCLELITDGLTWPGRAEKCRPMTKAELDATLVTRLELKDGNVSCKIRAHPASDDDADADYPVWAGNVPLRTASLPPVDAPHNNRGERPPSFATCLRRPGDPPLVTPLSALVDEARKSKNKHVFTDPATSALFFWRSLAIALFAVLATFVLFVPDC